ncbi:glycoside hydrolase family 95 protein [Sphingobacterium sp. SGG-5]|uniref:glycoside hydrolase family 95 protein n=1 Tax=Sphingobacterium sp. SGG-5 TaxID=2710881 RepID=UPI0013E9E343|nr:glycoside hydrolase family 95 protein [Sphingobacterium sp. SGG-5]NGM60637.1 glycoside hydrolase family 95 protein [Sphingobacterium sp. SGG-5]
MHIIYFFLLFSILPACVYSQNTPSDVLTLSYNNPAEIWEEALPLGNGQTGAMVFGRIHQERYQLNDHTLWSGYPQDGNNPKAAQLLPVIRQQIFTEDYAGAEKTWRRMQGPYSARYLPLGDLWLTFEHEDSVASHYNRTLDLTTATAKVGYTIDGIRFTRETFISHPARAMVVQIRANKKGTINFTAGLTSKLKYKTNADGDRLVMQGKAPKYVAARHYFPEQVVYDDKEGMAFVCQIRVKTKGGKVLSKDSLLHITDADEVTIYLTESTSFNGFDKSPGLEGKDPEIAASGKMETVYKKRFNALRKAHIQDYQHLFNRVSFRIETDRNLSHLPTNARLKAFASNPTDYQLQMLYFQFGRYLMISGSRPGSRPTNLQGIWNDHIQPPWGSNYTININTEMNYWPAENANLSECHRPLFDFMHELAVNGAKTAKVNYGIDEGWVAHHNSDLWAKTSPVGHYDQDKTYYPGAFCWHMGGAWLSTHLWEHYQYTLDKEFLKHEGYPLMKGAALFMLHWLVKDPQTGYLVTAPSTSPENVFTHKGERYNISKATTMDIAIIRELFQDVIQATQILDTDEKFRNQVEAALTNLYPYHIGKYGQIQEWFDDVDDPLDKHRHISHLFGLFPGTQISIAKDAILANAAKQTLIHRGDVSTGWSMAWKINWWARLQDGEHAYKILTKAFNYINPNDKTMKTMGGGGTYPNLFDAHPPFQIDGNFGATAGIIEMLMQSHEGEIHLLPALPQAWQRGYIKGIKARGNFEIDLHWAEGKLQKAYIKSLSGSDCQIKSAAPIRVVGLKTISNEASTILNFKTRKGKTYSVVPL